MRAKQFTSNLKSTLPTLAKYNSTTIDDLVRKLASRHKLTNKAAKELLMRQKKSHLNKDDEYHTSQHGISEDGEVGGDQKAQIEQFIDWSIKTLHVQEPYPQFELSTDTEEASTNHHTGQNNPSENTIWVYVKNRNLVDIFRTVFHELVHTRQSQLGMIKPGSSYPGSPIEAMADMLAGKYIKIYGEQHHEIFQ